MSRIRRPGPTEVVINVTRAGINFADLLSISGHYAAAPPPPFTPGLEVSGTEADSGRPVIAQDTGLAGLYPLGDGLLSYSTLAEAAAAVESVTSNYPHHARAAREIAEGEFDSDRVLKALVERIAS